MKDAGTIVVSIMKMSSALNIRFEYPGAVLALFPYGFFPIFFFTTHSSFYLHMPIGAS